MRLCRRRAQQRTRFFDQYRSYVINYNLGWILVRQYIERRGGTEKNPAKRWEEFTAPLHHLVCLRDSYKMSPVKSKIPKEDRPFLDRLLDEVRYRLTTVDDIDIAGQSLPRYVW